MVRERSSMWSTDCCCLAAPPCFGDSDIVSVSIVIRSRDHPDVFAISFRAAVGGGGFDNLPDFFKTGPGGGGPAGGEPGIGGVMDASALEGGLDGGLEDDENLEGFTFGGGFDIPLPGMHFEGLEGDGSLGGIGDDGAGGVTLADRAAAVAEFDDLAEITGQESGARSAAAAGLGLAASVASAAPGGGGDDGGWGNINALQAAYMTQWQQAQVRLLTFDKKM